MKTVLLCAIMLLVSTCGLKPQSFEEQSSHTFPPVQMPPGEQEDDQNRPGEVLSGREAVPAPPSPIVPVSQAKVLHPQIPTPMNLVPGGG